MKRAIKGIHKAVYEPIGNLVTFRAMPTQAVPMNAIDPFIFLNHHGYQEYPPNNHGLPFGPHPHRGFETVTFILKGDLTHKDNSGANSVIKTGGVQWMTAGSGLVHAEVSSDEFKSKGGPLEILQLWLNLPAKYKMVAPKYTGLQKDDIPTVVLDNGKAVLHPVAGDWNGYPAPFEPLTDVHLSWMDMKSEARVSFSVPSPQNIFFYVVKGDLIVNETPARMHHLIEFSKEGEEVEIIASTDAIILFGYATPFNEPFVAYGPFVMNTKEEIMQAYEDYNKGKFGDAKSLMD